MSRIIIHNHLPRAKDAATGPALNAQGKPVAYGKYQANKMGMEFNVDPKTGLTPAQKEAATKEMYGSKGKDASEHMVAGLTLTAFTKLVNKAAKEMDADSDYYETVSIAQELGATPEQAKEVAHELGRRP